MVINIVGGFVIGVMQLKMQFGEALGTYTLLTVGDGLVSQIPALLISTATGIIVTRAASSRQQPRHGRHQQLFSNPRALGIVGFLMLGMALIPGLPQLPVHGHRRPLLLGAALTAAQERQDGAARRCAEAEAAAAPRAAEPENLNHLLRVDPIEHRDRLRPDLAGRRRSGGNLLSRVTLIRRQIATDLGIIVPTIRIRDDLQLPRRHVRRSACAASRSRAAKSAPTACWP